MSDEQTWKREDAIEVIAEIIGDTISEDALSDHAVQKLAEKIVDRMEAGPK